MTKTSMNAADTGAERKFNPHYNGGIFGTIRANTSRQALSATVICIWAIRVSDAFEKRVG